MMFQNYVYTLYDDTGKSACGVFATFKEAYEKIEKYNEDAIAIIDNGDEHLGCSFFDVIRSYKYDFMNKRYIIMRNLLTVFPDDKTVSYEMAKKLEEQCKKNKIKNYKTKNDFM